MLRRFLLISLTILISSACSCEGKKQQKTNHVAVSAGQITEENCNLIGENLQAFLTQNAKIPMPKGVHISGDELKEFLSLDQVNHYDSAWNKSRKEWVDALLNSGTEYKYCGTLDVSDSLDCYVYTAENKEELGYRDAFALLVKNGSAIGSVQFACEGYGLGNSIVSNRVSRNTFVMASFAVDMIDENGDSPGGYYSIRINDDWNCF